MAQNEPLGGAGGLGGDVLAGAVDGLERFAVAIGSLLAGEGLLLLHVVVYIIALTLGAMGLIGMAKSAEESGGRALGRSSPFGGPLVTVIVAVVMLALPSFMDASTVSIFGSSAKPVSALSYDGSMLSAAPAVSRQALQGILQIVVFFGWIAVVRGLFKLRAAANRGESGGFGSGVTHIIGGVLAANIVGVIDLLQAAA